LPIAPSSNIDLSPVGTVKFRLLYSAPCRTLPCARTTDKSLVRYVQLKTITMETQLKKPENEAGETAVLSNFKKQSLINNDWDNDGDYWTCDICDGDSSTGCQYFDPTECPKFR